MKIAKTAAAKRATEDLEKRNSQQRTTLTVGVESESITLHQDYFLAPGVK